VRHTVFLDDDEDLRLILCYFISGLENARCTGFGSLDELQANQSEALGADLVILDVNLGADKPTGVDAYRWLCDMGYRGQIVFLTGHASSHPQVEEAWHLPGVTVLEKPVDIGVIGRLATGTNTTVNGASGAPRPMR
jgi:FixJ family two-component response regulator